MTKIKKITAVNMAAVILAMSLTACGSNDVENMPDEQDVLKNAISETPDESLPEAETYEDYIKLADTYLQTDDVLQALAVLDEGIEKLSAGEQGVENQDVDLISQRKDMEKAAELLRERGIAKAVKKEGRIAAEGVVGAYVCDKCGIGVLLEINCESDFVSRGEKFHAIVDSVAKVVAAAEVVKEEPAEEPKKPARKKKTETTEPKAE